MLRPRRFLAKFAGCLAFLGLAILMTRPMKYSLAFSEHNYGIALPFFPLFTLGVRPLTVHGLATLLGFALAGCGKSIPDSLRLLRRPEAILVGGIWALIGFFGSLEDRAAPLELIRGEADPDTPRASSRRRP